MSEIINALAGLLPVVAEHLFNPFVGAVLILMLFGHKAGTKWFTKDKAYTFRGHTLHDRVMHKFYFFGRGTIGFHAVIAGAVLGYFWRDPSPEWTGLKASVQYFVYAGGVAEVLRLATKLFVQWKGLKLSFDFPGESEPAPAMEAPFILDSTSPDVIPVELVEEVDDAEDDIPGEDTKPSVPAAKLLESGARYVPTERIPTSPHSHIPPPPKDAFVRNEEVSKVLRGLRGRK